LKEENDKKIARQKAKALRTLRKGVTIMRRASHYHAPCESLSYPLLK